MIDLTPQVSFAKTRDGPLIAYGVCGDGPPLVYVRSLNSHVQRDWGDTWRGSYLKALAHAFTVITFDARGNGLSEPVESIDVEGLVEDVRAVVDDLSLRRFAIYGQGFGSPIAMAYAARFPDRVERVILYCAYARGSDLYIPDFFLQAFRESPPTATAIMGHATYPDVYKLPGNLLSLSALAATPETAILYFELVRTLDVTDIVSSVAAPTLVMQPKANRVVPLELGEELARALPDARLVRVSTGSYNPWGEEAVEPTLTAISDFVGRPIPLMPVPRRMAVLVTDLVGSTEMTHRLGEARARELFKLHDRIVRDARRKHRGAQVKHTGDGTMARFDDANAAVACALDIQEQLAVRNRDASDPLRVRVGVAYGEVVEEREDLAVRIMDRAAADQILVSESVRENIDAERFQFGAASDVELKGFPEPVAVYEPLRREV
jgi:class 3 adenylate cyclase